VTRYTQYGILFTTLVSILGVLVFPSVISLWYVIGTLFIPALLLPLSTSYYRQWAISSTMTFSAMLAGFGVACAALVAGHVLAIDGVAQYPFGIEPMYGGLTVSIGMYIWSWFRHERKHPSSGMGV
jgi:SSS family solute:Na+ symporter